MKLKKPTHLIAIVVLILFVTWLANFSKLIISEIKLESVHCASVEDIKGLLKSDKFYFWEITNISGKIRSSRQFPCIESANISLELPNKIKLIVLGRNPVLAIKSYQPPQLVDFANLEATPSSISADIAWDDNQASESSLVVDKFGVIFSPQQHYDIPLFLTDQGHLELGMNIESDLIQKLVQITGKLKELEVSDKFLQKTRDYLLASGPPKINISLSRDLSNQLASLQLILSKSKIDQREIDSIDLRFNKPVVVYVTKKKS